MFICETHIVHQLCLNLKKKALASKKRKYRKYKGQIYFPQVPMEKIEPVDFSYLSKEISY